jgi:hypothetical protein
VRHMLASLTALFFLGFALPCTARAESIADAAGAEVAPIPPEKTETKSKSFGHRVLFWIPNRAFDVLDLVRLRVRVGPGFTLGVRATELVDVNLGAHATLFAGVHGPRNTPQIPWPVGPETYAGIELSVADAGSDEDRFGPQYGPMEVGFGTHLALIGFDVGVEPYDALDLVLGILTFDPKGDDF